MQELRFAARLLAKERWFTLSAVVALALGIGVNVCVFTIINGMNLRALPVDRPEQIVYLGSIELEGQGRGMDVSYPDFRDLAAGARTFSGLAAYAGGTMNVGDDDRPADRLTGAFISANAFPLLRVEPVLGRRFSPEDDRPGAPAVAILTHAVWTERYGAEPSIAGRPIRVNGSPVTVVGVMPEGFRFPLRADIWQPLAQMPGLTGDARDRRRLRLVGRLRDGADIQQARAEMTTLAAGLAQEHPATNAAIGVTVTPFAEVHMGSIADGPPMILLTAAALVLLIACANAANLLVARAVHRSREVALRAALGASRIRILRQLVAESVLLAALAGGVGLALSAVALRFFEAEAGDLNLPYWVHFGIDGRVFAYLVLICLGTALAFGLLPAWHLSKTPAYDALKDGGRAAAGGMRPRRWAGVLLVAEIALTVALLAGAGLLVRSSLALSHADAVLDARALFTARVALPPEKLAVPEQVRAFHVRLEDRLAAAPGIAATLASARPFVDAWRRQLEIDGERAPEPRRRVQVVAAGDRYFETLGVPLVKGRTLTRADAVPGRESVVINERFAALHFAGAEPIGRRIRLLERDTPGAEPWLTIVGVSRSIRQQPYGDVGPLAYVPLGLGSTTGLDVALIVRGSDAASIVRLLRAEVQAIDADAAVYGMQPLARLSELSRWAPRVVAALLTAFAAIATLLSAMGLYAVTAYGVSQRTAEIGIRMALGARRSQVLWLFLRRTLVHVGLGVAFGVAGALAVGQVLRSFLIRTSATDPLTFGGTILLLVAVAAAASVIPARRAARLDPVTALRRE